VTDPEYYVAKARNGRDRKLHSDKDCRGNGVLRPASDVEIDVFDECRECCDDEDYQTGGGISDSYEALEDMSPDEWDAKINGGESA
jgi:hypothetical protein